MATTKSSSAFRLRHAVVGVVLFLLFFLSALPAWLLPWLLNKYQINQLVITNPEGSFWNGKASGQIDIPVASSPSYKLLLDQISWSWRPARLFAGELAWNVLLQNNSAKFNASLGLGFGGINIRSAQAEMAAQMVTDIYPAFALFKPEGKLLLTSDDFNINKNNFSGKAQLDWRGAQVIMSPVKPLGEYRALLNATGSAAELQVSTLSGALKLNGKGNWTSKDGVRFSGTAQAEAAQAANIDPLLQLTGKAPVNGVYPLEWPPK
ncbi:MAG: type II secretion system protein N [Burkholderiales bacterium]